MTILPNPKTIFKCDSCGLIEVSEERKIPTGWTQQGYLDRPGHFCPKCNLESTPRLEAIVKSIADLTRGGLTAPTWRP